MTDFDARWLGEPSLKFGDGGTKDPRAGLLKHGSWTPGEASNHNEIYVGFIGTSHSTSAVKRLFTEMGTVIPRAEEEPQRHKPLFPALGTDSAFRVSFTMLDRWTWEMPLSDVDLVADEPTTDKSVETLLDLMETYINDLAGDDPPPNVIVIPLPEDVEEACTHPDNSREE